MWRSSSVGISATATSHSSSESSPPFAIRSASSAAEAVGVVLIAWMASHLRSAAKTSILHDSAAAEPFGMEDRAEGDERHEADDERDRAEAARFAGQVRVREHERDGEHEERDVDLRLEERLVARLVGDERDLT